MVQAEVVRRCRIYAFEYGLDARKDAQRVLHAVLDDDVELKAAYTRA